MKNNSRDREVFMTRFSVGEQVIVRFGREQGQRAKVIQSQPADVYKVKVENGAVLFFSGKGLAKEEVQPVIRRKCQAHAAVLNRALKGRQK